jgi:hypothetical protein
MDQQDTLNFDKGDAALYAKNVQQTGSPPQSHPEGRPYRIFHRCSPCDALLGAGY